MKRHTIILGALAALSFAAPHPEITLKQPSRPQPHPHPLGSVTLRKHRHSGVAAARRAKRKGKRQ
jgi:hypothetical protein|nr:MAG TPA: hypothetical protein [Caudoviricetes sp.]DAX41100.1 MAG TPA: hypothetical protein [Caudoviricetes sp.]